MGTFIKYLFYVILIVVIYLIGKGVYEGKITETTTVGEVSTQVDDGFRNIAAETKAEINKGVQDYQKKAKETSPSMQ